MRTLKFRYWNTITKEMVNNPKMPYKENWTIEQLFEDRGWVWMQFTGLTDRHGVEIYEGDILRVDRSLIEEVKWVDENNWLGDKCPVNGWVNHQSIYKKPVEVIGNIYENPELLNKEAV